MPTDLITRERAVRNLGGITLTAAENLLLDALVPAVSQAIRRFCGRDFSAQQHDELYDGNGQCRLVLRHFPILSVERVAWCPAVVFQVTNTSASNQRATVKVTSTGLTLTRIASGTTTVNELTFASNATLSALKTAIDALSAGGWSASLPDAAFNNRASSDLRSLQGALNALQVTAGLKMHALELADYEIDAGHGWLLRSQTSFDFADTAWNGGIQHWRVIYTAGFESVPEDVQEAAAGWVAALFWQAKRDPGLASETIVGSVTRTPHAGIPPSTRGLLDRYRDFRV